MLKHFVEYLYLRILGRETSVEEIAERDVQNVTIANCCFGFRFFDQSVSVVDGKPLTGDRENISNWYYLGEKMTLEEVKQKYGNDHNYRKLIRNMEKSAVTP